MVDDEAPSPRSSSQWTITLDRELREVLRRSSNDASALGWVPTRFRAIRQGIYDLRGEIFDLVVRFAAGRVVLSGTVASEQARETIKLVVSSSRSVVEIDDRIVITAPFASADDEDFFGHRITPSSTLDRDPVERRIPPSTGVPQAIAGGPVSVTRHPSIRPLNRPEAGARFFVEVDLALDPDGSTSASPMEIHDVAADWRSLDVDVEVHSTGLRFAQGANNGTIEVRRGEPSVPVRFEAMVSEEAGRAGHVDLLATFSHKGRHGGVARRTVAVATSTSAEKVATTGSISVVPDARVPDLTIKILSHGGQGSYLWILDAPRHRDLGGPSARHGSMELGPSSRDFAHTLLERCPDLAPSRHGSMLRGVGERIWQRAPDAFKRLYRDLRGTLGPRFPIQLVTDEPHVPWEMMHPDGESQIPDPDHLFMTHPMTRWLADDVGKMPASFTLGSIASFVPDYGPGKTLAAAIDEGEWLVAQLSATAEEPTCARFTAFWADPLPPRPVGVVHFAGHGSSGREGGQVGLKMRDGWVTPDEVHSGVALGRRDRSYVVINACEVGGADRELGVVEGWAASLTRNGFGGVLAPIWAVRDEHASKVVRRHLELFVKGSPLGESMTTARSEQRAASSTPFAYVCHGDVMATMTRI